MNLFIIWIISGILSGVLHGFLRWYSGKDQAVGDLLGTIIVLGVFGWISVFVVLFDSFDLAEKSIKGRKK